MKSTDRKMYDFLSSTGGQLCLPIYQRNFVWDTDEYQKLFDDIISDNKGHWLDRTVVKKFNEEVISGDFFETHIIDGQQRITSIIVLYTAICAWCKNNNFDGIKWETNIYNSILIDNRFDGDQKYKLRLDGENNRVLWECIDKLPKIGEVKSEQLHYPSRSINSNKIIKMYNHFYKILNKNNICTIYDNIRKVEIIDVECDKDDDGQKIFNSINSTGKPLELYEIIKNLSLMNLPIEKQKEYYYNYWLLIMTYFYRKNRIFNNFIQSIATYHGRGYQQSRDPTKFFIKTYFNNGNNKEFFNVMEKCFKWYKICDGNELFGNHEIDEILKNLRIYSSPALLYPIIFKLFDYYEKEESTLSDLRNALILLDTHLFRCFCANKNISAVLKTIKISNINERLTQSLYSALTKEHPPINDNLFKSHLCVYDKWYNQSNRKVLKNILNRIERSYHSNEEIDFTRASIEHIMPQTLTKLWEEELGENYEDVHSVYLNRLGNLTIAPYNSELSNNSFNEKKSMKNGFEEDRNYLSKHIIKFDKWDKESIIQRSNELAERLCSIFKYPDIYKTMV